jgi:putative transposase
VEGDLNQEGQGRNRRALRHLLLEERCVTAGSRLDSELQAWRSRPLEAEAYPYLFVDARYEKVRVGHKVVSQGVLLVSGARDDGFREILGVEAADTESEATYQALFCSLKSRGLPGVELVISDDHKGLKATIARHFQRHRGNAAKSTM